MAVFEYCEFVSFAGEESVVFGEGSAPRLQCRWCWFRRDVVERTGRLWMAAAAKAFAGREAGDRWQ